MTMSKSFTKKNTGSFLDVACNSRSAYGSDNKSRV